MINPILASSARRRMRSWRTCAVLMLYGAAALIVPLLFLNSINAPALRITAMRSGIDGYVSLVMLQFVMIVLVAPAMTAGSIAGEREKQTLELMLVTQTGALRIVIGKLLESFMFLALLVVTTLPMLSVVLLTGGVTIAQIGMAALFLLCCAFAALCVGLFASALAKRTVTATVVAYLMIFAIGIGTIIPVGMGMRGDMAALGNNRAALAALTPEQAMRAIPAFLFINPILGLISLLAGQTGLLAGTMRSMPGGYYAMPVFEKMGFDMIAYVNMSVMVALGLALVLVAAAMIRPRARRARKRK